jgi:hypothetical protein
LDEQFVHVDILLCILISLKYLSKETSYTRRRKLLKNLIPHYSRNIPYKQTKQNKTNKQTNKTTH